MSTMNDYMKAALEAARLAKQMYTNYTSSGRKKRSKAPNFSKNGPRISSASTSIVRAPRISGKRKNNNKISLTRALVAPAATSNLVGCFSGFSGCTFQNMKGLCMTGRQRLVDVATDSTGAQLIFAVATPSLFAFYIDPNAWPGPINKIASAFAHFRVVALDLSYNALVPSSAIGGYALGYQPDAAATHNPTVNGIMTLNDSFETSVWTSCCFNCQELDKEMKYDKLTGVTSAEERWSSAGLAYIRGTVASLGAGTIIGTVYVDYKIEFYGINDSSNDATESELKLREGRSKRTRPRVLPADEEKDGFILSPLIRRPSTETPTLDRNTAQTPVRSKSQGTSGSVLNRQ